MRKRNPSPSPSAVSSTSSTPSHYSNGEDKRLGQYLAAAPNKFGNFKGSMNENWHGLKMHCILRPKHHFYLPKQSSVILINTYFLLFRSCKSPSCQEVVILKWTKQTKTKESAPESREGWRVPVGVQEWRCQVGPSWPATHAGQLNLGVQLGHRASQGEQSSWTY